MAGLVRPDPDFTARLGGQSLTTAEVIYYMPAHPALLQSFLWQTMDVAPDFPRVQRFLEFWRREIDAAIHSVSVSAAGLVTPARIDFRDAEFTIN